MQILDLPIDPEGMETTEHGSYSFPLAIYHSVLSKNVLGHTPWHWHKEIQFCLVTAGRVRFLVNERQYLLLPGDGVFVNSGCLHMARPEVDPDSSYICLDADPRLISSFPGSALEERYVTPFLKDPALAQHLLSPGVPWQKEILDRVRQAYQLYETRPFGWELRLSILLQEMWLLLLDHRPMVPAGSSHRLQENAVVRGILTYISQNYDRRISLPEIAQAVSFSPSECCRLFKRLTGDTIFSSLQTYRVARAAQLLRDTDRSVSQIAYDAGFSSTSYFIQTFRKHLGLTPLQFRKEKQERSRSI